MSEKRLSEFFETFILIAAFLVKANSLPEIAQGIAIIVNKHHLVCFAHTTNGFSKS